MNIQTGDVTKNVKGALCKSFNTVVNTLRGQHGIPAAICTGVAIASAGVAIAFAAAVALPAAAIWALDVAKWGNDARLFAKRNAKQNAFSGSNYSMRR